MTGTNIISSQQQLAGDDVRRNSGGARAGGGRGLGKKEEDTRDLNDLVNFTSCKDSAAAPRRKKKAKKTKSAPVKPESRSENPTSAASENPGPGSAS